MAVGPRSQLGHDGRGSDVAWRIREPRRTDVGALAPSWPAVQSDEGPVRRGAAQYRPWGSAPASHFIDALMGHLGHDYYVALLSAAEVHGFAHQRPQVFQVMTPARLRERAFGRVRIRFITDASMAGRAVDIVNTPTGTMRVSAIETTVLDLLAHPRSSGGLSNVATIVGEMLEEERIDIPRLAGSAVGYPTSVIQRCGWLLDFMAHRVQVELNTEALAASITSRRSVLLDPSGRRAGEHDARWQVIVNATPEPDL